MADRNPPDSGTASLVQSYPLPRGRTTLEAIAAIPEEHLWLASRKSPRTRRAYRQDVEHFMRTIGIRSVDELRGMDHRAVLAWEAYMREVELAEASTIRLRLAALSSLFKHLIKHGAADRNPVRDVERPPVNRRKGSTLAFSKVQARRLLDARNPDTVAGLRDRAILSGGLQAGLRRAEIAGLTVGDLHVNRGFDSLRVVRKGAKKDAMAINPQTAQRIRDYRPPQATATTSKARSFGPSATTASTGCDGGTSTRTPSTGLA
jgi:site-specific recombinase XerD